MTDTAPSGHASDTPIHDFSQCHAGILQHLDVFEELPALLAPLQRARAVAQDMIGFFRDAAFEHHQDEERALFPAVLRSSEPGEEREDLARLVEALTREHRDIEAQWAQLEPALKKLAKGQLAAVDGDAVQALIAQYRAHARYEETAFLPRAEALLRRNGDHLAALGLALHIRHQPPVFGHV